jgi:hypothetical protein
VYAPDVVEPIVGWRLWRIAERGGSARLRSLFVHDVWPYLEPLQARCAVPRLSRRRRPPHDPPVTDCDCGIYATSWRDVSAHLHASWRRRPGFVVGEVDLWGSVVEAEHGWRGTYAYPRRLFLLAPRKADAGDVVRLTTELERYGVEVDAVELRDTRATVAAITERVGAV